MSLIGPPGVFPGFWERLVVLHSVRVPTGVKDSTAMRGCRIGSHREHFACAAFSVSGCEKREEFNISIAGRDLKTQLITEMLKKIV